MENDPSQCFFTAAESRIRAGTGAPFARSKEQHHICMVTNETMTVLLTSGSNPERVTIYGEPESPKEGVCLRYDEPESPNEEACLRYMMIPYH